jgi:hypothetical protein
LKKVSLSALKVYKTALAMIQCPLDDDVKCNICKDVDWSQPMAILTATPECKATFNEHCMLNPNATVCGGCYMPEKQNDPLCKSIRNLVQGGNAFSAIDLETYKKENKLCACPIVSNTPSIPTKPVPIPTFNDAIIDFYKAETNYVHQEDVKDLEPTFWEWFVKLFKP